jgi:phospholipase/carboxylesterase
MSAALVILLHGVGSRGADLAPLGRHCEAALPGLRAVAPDAPFAFDGGGQGRQWFSVAGVSEANRAGRILAARPAFARTIDGLIEQEGFAGRHDRVALLGFSQGAIMALDAVVSASWRVRGVVAIAGRLASPRPFAPAPQADVLVVHGAADPVMPVALSAEAVTGLDEAGILAHRHVIPGMGHAIGPQAVTVATRFLQQVLGLGV